MIEEVEAYASFYSSSDAISVAEDIFQDVFNINKPLSNDEVNI